MPILSREQIAEQIANRLLEEVDQKTLERVYWDMQYEWAETLSDEDLMETAKDLDLDAYLLEMN